MLLLWFGELAGVLLQKELNHNSSEAVSHYKIKLGELTDPLHLLVPFVEAVLTDVVGLDFVDEFPSLLLFASCA